MCILGILLLLVGVILYTKAYYVDSNSNIKITGPAYFGGVCITIGLYLLITYF